MAKIIGRSDSDTSRRLYGKTNSKKGEKKKLLRQVRRSSVRHESHVTDHDNKARKVLDDDLVTLQLSSEGNKE